MEEVSIPLEVLEKAEVSETRSRVKYVSSGEYINDFIRRFEAMSLIQGGNHGKRKSFWPNGPTSWPRVGQRSRDRRANVHA